MSELSASAPLELGAEDAKLVTLARSARARNAAPEGAALRDDTGRTYVATTVALTSMSSSALRAAVVMALASGARGFEAAAVVTSSDALDPGDLAVLTELTAGVPVFLAGPDGVARAVVTA